MTATVLNCCNALLVRELVKVFFKAQSNFGVGCMCRRPPGDEHDVKRLGPTMSVMPEGFTAQTLDSVPLNGRAHFFGND